MEKAALEKILLVGAGRWGSLILKKLSQRIGRDRIIVADVDISRVQDIPFRWTTDYRSALMDVHAVCVATQPSDHYDITLQSLLSGRHVLVEKPMTLDSKTAKELYDVAVSRNLTLMTDSTWEYDHAFDSLLADPCIDFEWTNARLFHTQDSVLWVNGPHPVALALRAFGKEPETVITSVNVPDYCIFNLFWPNGSANVVLRWREGNKVRTIRTVRTGSVAHSTASPDNCDPVDHMIDAFLKRCVTPWQDRIGFQVVRTLERVDKQWQEPT